MVGQERAEAIVRTRPFSRWQDVEKIPGFSKGIIDDLKSGGARIELAGAGPRHGPARHNQMWISDVKPPIEGQRQKSGVPILSRLCVYKVSATHPLSRCDYFQFFHDA
jgi:hypothetical protein